ncbi:phenylalanine--tRNA ligase subunit alpha [Capillimicrobium parvum]|uniref:Phenylalanine--tRNA ligase alpha subunit n=1 Tax=Capillimicrobium parvum TaxID=2884022 RepID=A0A9E6XXJ0_9ACTN|nr:phenylalanine--tRNA ligase subunit alpha [Capillimicrobium parvum]UGS36213.1 Phenylalanine--tRNA ligase alpha subunit [Capillimicrobium parvum]
MIDRIEHIAEQARTAVEQASTTAALEQVRVQYLGRKAELPNLLRGVAELPPEQRGAVGKAANVARRDLEAAIAARGEALQAAELETRLVGDRVDVTLPGDPPQPVGRLHVLTQTRREIEDVFVGLGFSVLEGPEVESVFYNFDALNHTPTHPARARTDTFYIEGARHADTDTEVVLRTHTSPMQIRAMQETPPPLYVIIPGRVYRRDSDATHTPQFHQVEGLAVDTDITLADLKGTLLDFSRAIFGPDREVRLRPHFFPFTEPSVEVDVSCFNCARDGSPCQVCKGTGWLEILGAGMVDPNVFGYVREHGYDPDEVQGFAFGMGIERIAALKYGIPDIRTLYTNDVRVLEQFG